MARPVAFPKDVCHPSCWKPNRDAMKDTDVRQGTLALMVLKTLDVLGPLHGYGIARRIEQISGDLLSLNQGTHTLSRPVKARAGGFHRLRLGCVREQSPGAFLPADSQRAQTTADRDARLGTDRGHYGSVFCS